ncbi:RagB/SusD family nutrient uptake outer membrane protein [Aestuariibaculum sediminum]|uniref:RagB/SusD family nutrient uptake outer membrane protein n=1 Tax=Aestuariibaculum sediminum TaxID=2770637 RepID=A0A8J6Q1C2_9FLAO|nr:RagB/SusD family nutrient uptake outer membrane protein [Aestuariibaculum sediminum]MBD0832927.1 RagB/SusD family nutrient uptake outer membrane protein [Aestuariibaculum sediminum]
MRIKYILAILVLNMTIVGCDDILDKYPQDELSGSVFWKTENDFKAVANDLYSAYNLISITDGNSIDYFSNSNVSRGAHDVPNTDGVWNSAYAIIRRANFLIESAETSTVEETIKNRYIGEARYFRGLAHFLLVQRYGDVPLVETTLDFSELEPERDSRATVINKVVEDIEFAAANLPNATDAAGRVSRGAALGMLSRIGLYEGTHAKYHNSGSDANTLLTKAKNAAQTVISEANYSVFQSPLDEIFFDANQDNDEVIISIAYDESYTNVSPRGRGHVIDAVQDPTKYLADAFLCTDGLPIDQSPLFQGYGSLTTEFENRDPRMTSVIWEPYTTFDNSPLVPDLTRTSTGYWPKKPGDPIAQTVTFVYTDVIIMRLAEVLLNYAEAAYELDGSISDSDLDFSINKLRDRVGMVHLTNNHVTINNLDMKEEIRRERRIELSGEGFRYNDIIRWKTAENVLANAVLGAKFQQSDYPNLTVGTDVNLDADGFIIAEDSSVRNFDASKHYLFPLPLRELNLNPNLVQNPNWGGSN